METPDVAKSCIATLLLIFCAIDGLGKLLHPNETAAVNVRFRYFLERWMGGEYALKQNDIWAVRNEIMHNALNTISFMSHTLMGEANHLQTNFSNGKFFISTIVLCRDFKNALNMVEKRLRSDDALLQAAAQRLTFIEEDPRAYWSIFSTPPGPIKFITMQSKNS